MKLGQRIAALRNYKRLTQEQMAEALGVKRARYNAWENGISNPDVTMLAALANFHKVSVDFLLGIPHQDETAPLSDEHWAGYDEEAFYKQLERQLEQKWKLEAASPANDPYSLTAKDERDIAKRLEQIKADLASDMALAYNGEPLEDEDDREALLASIENTLKLSKYMAKKRFTPNKYRK